MELSIQRTQRWGRRNGRSRTTRSAWRRRIRRSWTRWRRPSRKPGLRSRLRPTASRPAPSIRQLAQAGAAKAPRRTAFATPETATPTSRNARCASGCATTRVATTNGLGRWTSSPPAGRRRWARQQRPGRWRGGHVALVAAETVAEALAAGGHGEQARQGRRTGPRARWSPHTRRPDHQPPGTASHVITARGAVEHPPGKRILDQLGAFGRRPGRTSAAPGYPVPPATLPQPSCAGGRTASPTRPSLLVRPEGVVAARRGRPAAEIAPAKRSWPEAAASRVVRPVIGDDRPLRTTTVSPSTRAEQRPQPFGHGGTRPGRRRAQTGIGKGRRASRSPPPPPPLPPPGRPR